MLFQQYIISGETRSLLFGKTEFEGTKIVLLSNMDSHFEASADRKDRQHLVVKEQLGLQDLDQCLIDLLVNPKADEPLDGHLMRMGRRF